MAKLTLPRVVAFFLLCLAVPISLKAEEPFLGVDLLFPELAHPTDDLSAAIRRRDFRFITINREMTIVPGVENYPRTVKRYGKKFMKQPLHLFLSRSRTFSYNIRVRAYAAEYNTTLLQYLLKRNGATG